MNVFKTSTTLLTAGVLSLGMVAIAAPQVRAEYETFELAPDFYPDPAVGTGISGGERTTEACGFIDTADAPDHTLYLNEEFDYLRVYVESAGDVTLYMEWVETGEVICVDDSNGTLLPEFEGTWPAGTYNIWIGDFDQAGYPYQLYITEL
ncbi:MAG: hypothetical protein F6K42_01955 [Leptolyngbya sp. SIO1D8]|nr:hypothetical protein [Leptolyngbya sp. SIO1D8]